MHQDTGITLKTAEAIISAILDNRKEIRVKNVFQLQALDLAAQLVERANDNGASMQREAGVLRYQANNPGAYLLCDKYTRKALEAGLRQIQRQINIQGGGEK